MFGMVILISFKPILKSFSQENAYVEDLFLIKLLII